MRVKGRKITQFSSVQSLSRVWLFATPWTTARQASLSISNSRSPPKPMSIESVMPSNHLILYRPLVLLPSIFPSNRVFSNDLALHIGWPKYWSFSFSIIPSKEIPGLISFRSHPPFKVHLRFDISLSSYLIFVPLLSKTKSEFSHLSQAFALTSHLVCWALFCFYWDFIF